jgi:hypothetical protein
MLALWRTCLSRQGRLLVPRKKYSCVSRWQ